MVFIARSALTFVGQLKTGCHVRVFVYPKKQWFFIGFHKGFALWMNRMIILCDRRPQARISVRRTRKLWNFCPARCKKSEITISRLQKPSLRTTFSSGHPPGGAPGRARSGKCYFFMKTLIFGKIQENHANSQKNATSWRPCQKHQLNQWFNIGFEGAVHAKSRFSSENMILHGNHD